MSSDSMNCCGCINIIEYGAAGDGVTDDTDVIQSAINEVAARGGGKIYFPFRPKGYRIAKPAGEVVDGHACRSQLYIPWTPEKRPNICLEGEMPCKLLNTYIAWYLNENGTMNANPGGRTPIHFELPAAQNTFLFSDWEAPEEHDPSARPWSLIGALEGDLCDGHFGPAKVSILNLEFRVKLNRDRMYPTMSACNLQNSGQANIRDSQFCLDSEIGDAACCKVLQSSPVHTAGLILPGAQNDDVSLDNVAVQGFRYGFVIGEHTIANYLYVHNCEMALTMMSSTHLSHIHHVVAQHNRILLAAPEELLLLGMRCSRRPVFITIDGVDMEPGGGHMTPQVSNLVYGVYDPENRLHGRMVWHQGWPTNGKFFPVKGAHNFHAVPFDSSFEVF